MKENILKLRRRIEEVTRTTKEKAKDITYVDLNGNLKRLNAKSNFVIYGRRGSGKTTLLLKSLGETSRINFPVYIQAELYKEHTYPNLVINILIQIFSQTKDSFGLFNKVKNVGLNNKIKQKINELKNLMDKPDDYDLSIENREIKNTSVSLNVKEDINLGKIGLDKSNQTSTSYTAKQKKIDYLNNHIDEFRQILSNSYKKLKYQSMVIYIDDFYHLNFVDQPYVADYLLRLCKDLDIYFRIATIKHRSNLYIRDIKQKIRGIQESAEHSSINLDFSLENFDITRDFLTTILINLCRECNCPEFTNFFVKTENGMDRVIWASGGVPRDFLLIVGYIIDSLSLEDAQNIKIDKRTIDSATKKLFQEKLQDLSSEYAKNANIMQFYEDVYDFCIKYNKRTAFIMREPTTDKQLEENVRNLMDHRLIHQVVKNMSLTKQHGSFVGFIMDIGAYAPFLNIKKAEHRIKEINILRKDIYKKDTLTEFRALSLKNEIVKENLEQCKKSIEAEKENLQKTKIENDYKDMIQKRVFDFA